MIHRLGPRKATIWVKKYYPRVSMLVPEPLISKHDLGVLVTGDAGLWRAKVILEFVFPFLVFLSFFSFRL